VAEASEQKIETRQLSWNKVPDMEEGSIMHGKIAKKGIGSKKKNYNNKETGKEQNDISITSSGENWIDMLHSAILDLRIQPQRGG
jgi:hypothetical protein